MIKLGPEEVDRRMNDRDCVDRDLESKRWKWWSSVVGWRRVRIPF